MELTTWADVDVESVASGTRAAAPDAATSLVFCAGAEEAYVVGPRTRGKFYRAVPVVRWKVRLRPGRARAVLGVSAHELVDTVVPLRDVWGGLARRGFDGLRAALRERLVDVDPARDAVVAEATRVLPGLGVAATARVLHVSERHLRTLFREAVGVSPKQYARLERVRRVVASGRPGSLAHLAAELGYYDQSHLNAEFRAAMGVAPGAFAAGRYPDPTPC